MRGAWRDRPRADSEARPEQPDESTDLPGTPPRLTSGQILVGWLQDYGYVAYWMVRGVFSRRAPDDLLHPARPTSPTVLLIPGVFESWRFLQPVADHLYASGHPVHVLDGLGYNTGTIPAMASVVSDYLEERDLQDVVVIAHSKGGLIAKCALARPGTARRVRHLVAISSPFSGSRYAYLVLLRSVRMFTPTGPVIRELAKDLAVNARISSLYSVFDPHIPETGQLDGAENIVLPTIGHFRPLGATTTLAVVDRILARSTDG